MIFRKINAMSFHQGAQKGCCRMNFPMYILCLQLPNNSPKSEHCTFSKNLRTKFGGLDIGLNYFGGTGN